MVGGGLYARKIGGFPFYDPTLLRIYQYGIVTALLALALAVLGIGRVRATGMILSGVMLLLWFAMAMAE